MDHSGHHMMAASTMGPSGAMMSKEVDHSTMDHSQMDHSQHGGGMDHSQHGGGMDHMDMMKMYFHVGVKEVILFSGWKTTTVSEMIGSCICLFVCALLYEGLKVFREELLVKGRNDMMRRNTPESLPTNDETGENGVNSDQVIIHPSHTAKSKICNKWHFLQSFLHIVQVIGKWNSDVRQSWGLGLRDSDSVPLIRRVTVCAKTRNCTINSFICR